MKGRGVINGFLLSLLFLLLSGTATVCGNEIDVYVEIYPNNNDYFEVLVDTTNIPGFIVENLSVDVTVWQPGSRLLFNYLLPGKEYRGSQLYREFIPHRLANIQKIAGGKYHGSIRPRGGKADDIDSGLTPIHKKMKETPYMRCRNQAVSRTAVPPSKFPGGGLPGLVIGLRHSLNQSQVPKVYPTTYHIGCMGGDRGAPKGHGFMWFMLMDRSRSGLSEQIPSGVVFGLKHILNQKKVRLPVLGNDAAHCPPPTPGFIIQYGGDAKAPEWRGYIWYETAGLNSFPWHVAARLPRGTVVGLKHSSNQTPKTLFWNGVVYDPANPHIQPPPGFKRMFGGDWGLPPGHGFFWYEKI